MKKDEWEENDEYEVEPSEELFDNPDEEEPARAVSAPPSLAQMERDGIAWARALDAILEQDPDTPTQELLEEMKKYVRPMSEYRPTQAEMDAIRAADIRHSLRGGKNREEKKEENDDSDEPEVW